MKKIISFLGLAGLFFALGISSASAAPDAITTLTCSRGSMAGSINIYWTVPAGATDGYEVRYYADPINSSNYGSASIYAQSFASGAVGGISEHVLVGLNAGSQYNFAVKALGALGAISDVSNSVSCMAGTSSPADSEAPTSRIIFPAFNGTAMAGIPLVIRGTARDNGLSSVQKIEVSVNSGVIWAEAKPIANDDGNIIWEFTWANPSAGLRTIMVRSTDWAGNTETPISQNINIVSDSVSSSPAPVVSPIPTVTPTLSPVPSIAPISMPANVSDGDLVRVAGGTKVYAIKGNYRRWIQSAEIFEFYPHFSFLAVKEITLEQLQSYTQSWLIRADKDAKVYEINGDGSKHWLNISAEAFSRSGRIWDMVYAVNNHERDFYKTGATVTR